MVWEYVPWESVDLRGDEPKDLGREPGGVCVSHFWVATVAPPTGKHPFDYTFLSKDVPLPPNALLASKTGDGRVVFFRTNVDGDVVAYARTHDDAREALGMPRLGAVLDEHERANAIPELRGTPRQVSWARELRAEAIAVCPSELLPALRAFVDARSWIDTKESAPSARVASLVAQRMMDLISPRRAHPRHELDELFRLREGVGRALADEAYAWYERFGEVPAPATQRPEFNGAAPVMAPLRSTLASSGRILGDEDVVAAYAARWRELLGRGAVFIEG